jgi:hypothetical protein
MPETTTDRVLRFLRADEYITHGAAASEVGDVITNRGPGRRASVNGGGDYAAQMLLGRMRKAGLVENAHAEGSTRWRLTSAGMNRARNTR